MPIELATLGALRGESVHRLGSKAEAAGRGSVRRTLVKNQACATPGLRTSRGVVRGEGDPFPRPALKTLLRFEQFGNIWVLQPQAGLYWSSLGSCCALC